MQVYPLSSPNLNTNLPAPREETLDVLIPQIGTRVYLPDRHRNFTVLNQPLVKKILSHRENAIVPLTNFLGLVQDERQITEGLYILDRMIDAGVKGIEKTYPVISRFNGTNSPNVQTMLAGIYRKTQVPDAFGPLMSMLIRNTFYPPQSSFDPNEEVGGAILEYLRNKTAAHGYTNH